MVLNGGGCATLLGQINRCRNSCNEEFSNDRYKCIVCGCVLNLATDNGKISYAENMQC